MAIRLSEGAIAAIVEKREQPVKPILQLINIRPISTGTSPLRYRLLMSDGVNTLSSFMLATQLNPLVDNESLAANAICKINRHIVNILKDGRMIVVLVDMEVIRNADAVATVIGTPVPYPDGSAGQGAKLPQGPAGATTKQGPAQPATGNSVGSMPKYSAPTKTPGTFGGSSLPTTPGGTQPRVVPINSLNPYQSRWTICARVTQKADIYEWIKPRNEGKVFHIVLVDESGEIKASAFGQEVDKFFPLVELNKAYYISKGRVKRPDKQYSSVNNEYEILFTTETTVIPCEDADHLPSAKFDFVSIKSLDDMKANSFVDVLGVCTSCGDANKIIIRSSNREVAKRDIHLLDMSCKAVTVTLWGNEAEKFDGSRQPVVAIKGAKVSDFNGRSLSVLSSSMFVVNPNHTEAFKLRAWFDGEGQRMEATSISRGQNFSVAGSYTNWKTLNEAQTENLGMGDKADYYSCVATTVHVRKEHCLYKACPNQDCNKKVIDEQNGLYRCEKCDREFPNFKYCMLLSTNIADFQATQWVTCFRETGETILGHTAASLGELRDKDNTAFDKVIENSYFNTFEFRIRAKEETYNDQTRLKATVVDIRPVDHVEYCKRLIASIRKHAA